MELGECACIIICSAFRIVGGVVDRHFHGAWMALAEVYIPFSFRHLNREENFPIER